MGTKIINLTNYASSNISDLQRYFNMEYAQPFGSFEFLN
jgi:hypothetical protein